MTCTVQWPSVVLNIGKWLAVMALVLAYGRQKDASYGFWRKRPDGAIWISPGIFGTGIKRPG